MPDFDKILKAIETALKLIFGGQVPTWISPFIGYSILIAIVLLAIWGVLLVISKIKELWVKDFLPLFYKKKEQHRADRRRRFADHIESEIRRLNNQEAWSDYRFTELEAEVEAEGQYRTFSLLPFIERSHSGLRHESSLSKALERSQERLILLEGDPGSGKSVALRHLVQSLARRAMHARSTKSLIPIYINFKELKRQSDEIVDRNLIQSFVFKSINRANDRDIEEYLEKEFDRGMQEGIWLFLFDSFDETPDILSSTEADATIREYSDAISDFLHSMNKCRGIVASRQFRGPGQIGWPRFRILPLTEVRRAELVHKTDLKSELMDTTIGQLGIASDEIRGMTSNPMFLGLLCDYMRNGNPFPKNAHGVFETYIVNRLERDKERLKKRFNLESMQIRASAEVIAFCMTADTGLGLSPTRENIAASLNHLGFSTLENFHTHLDALEYIKIARSETTPATGSKLFTFAHRRFQEYFATCIVLREPNRTEPRQLITDGRWRETAVVLCQTQPISQLTPILSELSLILKELSDITESHLTNYALEFANKVERSFIARMNTDDVIMDAMSKKGRWRPAQFPWTSRVLHVLGLLQDGFSNRIKELPTDIRIRSRHLILMPSVFGTLFDKKWALEVAGILPEQVLLWLLRSAFQHKSQWLKNVAYRQVAQLGDIPPDIASKICQALAEMALNGRLWRERHTTTTYLSRLSNSTEFLGTMRLLLFAPFIDLLIHLSILLSALTNISLLLVSTEKTSVPPILLDFFWVLMLFVAIIILLLSYLALWRGYVFEVDPVGIFLTRLLFIIIATISLSVTIDLLNLYLEDWSKYLSLGFSILISIYLGTWAPSAIIASRISPSNTPYSWILAPFAVIFRFTQTLMFVGTNKPQKTILIIGSILFYIVGIITIFGKPITLTEVIITILGKPITPLDSITNTLATIVYYGYFIIFILIGGGTYVIGGFNILLSGLNWIRGWIGWQSSLKNRKRMMSYQDFFISLENIMDNAYFCIRFIRTVRERNLLSATPEAEFLLKELALALEYGPVQLNKERGEWSSFEFWLEKYLNKKRSSSWNSKRPEILDEICILLDQVYANNRGSKVQVQSNSLIS